MREKRPLQGAGASVNTRFHLFSLIVPSILWGVSCVGPPTPGVTKRTYCQSRRLGQDCCGFLVKRRAWIICPCAGKARMVVEYWRRQRTWKIQGHIGLDDAPGAQRAESTVQRGGNMFTIKSRLKITAALLALLLLAAALLPLTAQAAGTTITSTPVSRQAVDHAESPPARTTRSGSPRIAATR